MGNELLKFSIIMKLKVQTTCQPNGNLTRYSDGMDKPEILPSNHPAVLKMRLQRVQNVKRKPRTLIEEAGVIIQLTSKKMARRAKG